MQKTNEAGAFAIDEPDESAGASTIAYRCEFFGIAYPT